MDKTTDTQHRVTPSHGDTCVDTQCECCGDTDIKLTRCNDMLVCYECEAIVNSYEFGTRGCTVA